MTAQATKLQNERMALSSDRSTVSITGSAGRQGPNMERPLLVQSHNAWPKVLRGREGRIGLGRVGDVTGHWKTSRLESKAFRWSISGLS